ncbi:VCBS domain-containing protein [Amphritea sp. HPY]|uniref:VCBS domain-containing protein n=1 Tax=Amphritea sp. HPY TaxID=3421652 RepID=UPI003D7D9250
MADNKYPTSDSTRNAATEDLFNQEATARINPNRKMSDDLHGHDELRSEELFMQNLQGRIDHDTADDLLPTIRSEGFSFEPAPELLDSLTESGAIPAGTVLAAMSVPVEGGDFSFTLNDDRFVLMGERLALKQDLTPQVGEEFSFAVQVSSNTSSFEIDVPVRIDFNDLAEFTEEYINQAPQAIELSAGSLDENSEAGTFVANLIAVDVDNDTEAAFELTGVGADLFEVVGTQLLVKEGAVLDFESQSQLSVEITATDSSGNSFTQTVTIDLNDINEAPLLDSAAFALNEGGGRFSAALQAEDQDINDQLTFVIEDGFEMPAGFELSTNGDYSFDPADAGYDHLAQGDSQIITVPVKVIDSGGLESTAQIKITITGTNDGPVAGADFVFTGDEGDSAISGLLGGSDVDAGTDLSYNADVTLPAGFTLDTDTGAYSFDPTDAAYNSMAVGDSQTLSIPVTVSDGDGGEAQQMITITIDGTNDAPVAGANVVADVNEGDSAISGSLGGSDVDAGTDLSYNANVDLPAGFTLDTDTGAYSFDPTDDAYNSMAVGDSQTLSIPVTVTDGDGGAAQQMITITIDGTNDAPVAGANVNASVEGGDSAISGLLGGSDVDAGTDLSYNADVTLPAGFTLDSDTGAYSFDPTDDAYNSMAVGDSQTLSIPVTVSDGDGGEAQQMITITIDGTNDAPVAGANVVADVNEGDSAISGSLGGSDVDAGTDLSYNADVTLPAGFTLDTDTGAYSFDPTDAAYNSMAVGDSQTLSIPVTVSDGDGGAAQQMITITIDGTNDAPVAGANVVADVNEGDSAISGSLGGSDVDAGTDLSYNADVTLPAGFTLDTDTGAYSFDPSDAAYNSMAVGDSQTLSIPVTVSDGDGGEAQQMITITIDGTNDAPVAGANVVADVQEGDSAISGSLGGSDVDAGTDLSYNADVTLPAGFTLDSDTGAYSFDPTDAAYNSMAVGDSQTLSIPVTVSDGDGGEVSQMITITIDGTNDAPVAGANVVAEVSEGDAAISGSLGGSDVDAGTDLSYNADVALPAGFTLDTDTGAYSFDPTDAAYNGMAVGDSQTLSIPVTVSDGDGGEALQMITITVSGTNDAPVAGANVVADVNEGDSAISGSLGGSDVDAGTDLSYNANVDLPAGFTLDTDTGAYSFDPTDAAYNSMAVGDSQTLSIPVTVSDGDGGAAQQMITITIDGTNDAPVAGGNVVADVNEGDAAISGSLGGSDVDAGTDLSYNATVDLPAGFTLDADTGAYSFDPTDDAYNGMAVGDSQTLSIPVTVSDGDGGEVSQMITITIDGTNDAPVAGANVVAEVNEGDSAISGSLGGSDVDAGTDLSYNADVDLPAGFTLDTDTGAYSFDPTDAAYNSMAVGDSQTLSIPVTVSDGDGGAAQQMITITIDGTNDAPVAGANVVAEVSEGDAAISGSLGGSDVDAGTDLSYNADVMLPAGFTLDSDTGAYSFDPTDAAYNSMAVGDSQTLSIPVTVSDGDGGEAQQMITITIDGTNDVPVAGANVVADVNEGDSAISGSLGGSDVDAGTDLSYSADVALPAGFTLDADTGAYSFDPTDAAYNSMAVGDSQTLSIPVTVSDGDGGEVSQMITITIDGTNDAPVAGANVVAEVSEGDAAISGSLGGSDVDAGTDLSYNADVALPAGFTLDTDTGAYSFDPTDAAYNGMAVGDSQTLSIPVTVSDGDGGEALQMITITVSGTNDAPVAGANVVADVNEGDSAISGSLGGSDVDAGTDLSYNANVDLPAGFTLDTDTGAYSFDPTDAAYNSMAVGDSQTLSIPVTVSDGDGGAAQQMITITIDGTNDAPVAGGNVVADVNEGDAAISGSLGGSDVDAGTDLSYNATVDLPAGFTLDADTGAYSFDPTDDAYNGMAVGDSQTLSIPVTVSDGDGGEVSQMITITIDGTNDAPVAGANVVAEVNEGDSAISGSLDGSDVDAGTDLSYNADVDLPAGFTLDTDTGAYSFDPTDAAYNSMAVGDSQTLSIPVTVTDGDGGEVSQMITITIDGTNDAPLAGANVVADVNEGDSAISGSLGGSDVDAGTDLSYNANVDLPVGFTLDADTGAYSFDPTDAAYNSMAVGDSQTLSIPVTVSDGDGGAAQQMITITIDGTNDAPVAGANVVADVNEGDSAISGSLGGSDVDAGTDLSYNANVDLPAGFTLDSDTGAYSFDPTDAAYNSMAVGDSQTLSIPVTVSDGDGGAAQQMITITIDGTNDAPVAGANVVADVNEGDSAISGSLGGSDVDAGTDLSYNANVDLPAGFTLDSDTGAYSFDPTDAAYNGMAVGDSQTLSIPVTVSDGDGGEAQQMITITVSGTNDAPVAGANVVADVDEGDSAISGSLGGSDVDAGTDLSYSANVDLPAGFTLDADTGSYSFDPTDDAYNSMAVGDSQTLSIPVTVSDGDGGAAQQMITITIDGTNDAPVAGANVVADVNEGDSAISGSLGGSVVDAGTDLSYNADVTLPAGFTLDSDTGAYSFDPTDAAYNSMAVGDSQTLSIPVTVSDGDGGEAQQMITITIDGTNDAPVAGANVVAEVSEGDSAISGSLGGSDVDAGTDLSYNATVDLPAGFTLDADTGAYSFDPTDAAYNSMAVGDSQTLSIPVTVSDGDGGAAQQMITITIDGTNDAPVAGANVVADVNEGDSAISGSLGVSDVDAGTDLSYNADVTLPAGFTLDADTGAYSFDPTDAAYNSMAVGDSQTLSIPVTVSDGDGGEVSQMITITIDGTNDAPVAGANVVAEVSEGDAAISGSLGGSDVDAGTDLSYNADVALPAGFTLDTDTGAYSFDPTDAAYNGMAVGDSQTLSIPVTVSDGDGGEALQMITITVSGTNDAPVAGANVVADVNEGDSAISGSLGGSDVDAGTDLSYNADVTLPAGFTLDTDTGTYSFDPTDAAYNSMAVGDSQTLDIPVTVSDGDGGEAQQMITITVSGTNDAPVAGANVVADVQEGDSSISGSLGGSDVDAGTDLSYNADVTLPAGFTLDSDTGAYSFDPTDAAYNSMAVGDSQTLSIPVTVSDGDGGEAQQMITITIDGTNDAPVAGANVVADVNEGDSAISGSLGGSDVDAGTDLSYNANVDLPAGFTLDTDTGAYSFDPTDAAYNSMAVGDSQTLSIPVTVSDGDGGEAQQMITITIDGTNDTPVAGAAVNREVSEGDAVISGSLGGSDVDAGTDLSYSANVDLPAGFTLDGDTGEYSFDPTDTAYDSLSSAESIQLQVPVTVSDGDGGTAQQLVTIDLQGTNDAPVAITSVGNTVDENAGSGIVVAALSATDVDAGETFSYNLTDSSGNFEIVGNQIQVKAGANIDFESAELHNVSVEVIDSAGNTYSENFALSVNNLNEGPTDITLSGGSVDENATGGAVVATLATADQDVGEAFTYNLADSSGNFEIVGNQIQVKAGANIDFESAELHNVSVEVTDSAGNTYSENFALSVNNLNEGPTDITLSGGSVDENATGGTVVATLTTADQDAGETFTYNLADSSGNFEIVGNQIQVKAGANIDFESAELHNVSVEVTDSAGNTYFENFDLSINNLNEGPTDITLSGGSVDENATGGTVVATLGAADQDAGETFTYSLPSDASGHFEIVGNQIQVKAGANIDFESAESHNITVQVSDSAGNTYSEQHTIQVIDQDDTAYAPVIEVSVGEAIIHQGFEASVSDPVQLLIDNSSFEDANLKSGKGTYSVSGWSDTGTGGKSDVLDPNGKHTQGGKTSDGQNLLYLGGDTGVEQALSDTFSANSQYTLSADLGVLKNDTGNGDFEIRLYAGDQLVGSVDDTNINLSSSTTTSVTLNVDSSDFPSGFSGFGEPLRIEVVNMQSTNSSYFSSSAFTVDNIQLTETTVVEAVPAIVEYPLDIAVSLTDTDGSESVGDITISGLPDGAVLSVGVHNEDGSWTVSQADLEGLRVTVPEGSGELNFTVSATSTEENGGDTATTTVDVNASGGSSGGEGYSSGGGQNSDEFSEPTIDDIDTDGLNLIEGTPGNGTFHAGSDNDHFIGDESDEKVQGDGGNDVIEGGLGDDTLRGNDGNDAVFGGVGDDYIRGNDGNDIVSGGEGDDYVGGGVGDDKVFGGAGDDELDGSSGADLLSGGAGNDTLDGGSDDDRLSGGQGNDTAIGGSGNDTYVFNPFDGNDSFSGGTGGGWTDTIELSADGSSDPDNPWTITVDGQELEYDIAAQALELNPDTSGVVTMADGSELTFEGIEKIEW